MALNAVRKITLKEILKGKPEKEEVVLDDKTKEMRVKEQDVCVVFGQAMTYEKGSTQFGDYVAFVGRFEARRLRDGEVFQSTRLIMPKVAEEMTLVELMDAQREDSTSFLNIAYVLGVEYEARGTEGYKWTVKPVSTGEERADPLDSLRQAISSQVPALQAPERQKAIAGKK